MGKLYDLVKFNSPENKADAALVAQLAVQLGGSGCLTQSPERSDEELHDNRSRYVAAARAILREAQMQVSDAREAESRPPTSLS